MAKQPPKSDSRAASDKSASSAACQGRRLRRLHYFGISNEAPTHAHSRAKGHPISGPEHASHVRHVHSAPAAPASDGMAEKYRDQLMRQQAEFDNVRKRLNREIKEKTAQANQSLIETLLPVIDNFQRALGQPGDNVESFVSGIKMIHRQMMENLERAGLKAIDAKGQTFDPTQHNAVSVGSDADAPDNSVLEVFQPGYALNDRLLRPAMVKVNKKA